MNPRKYIMNSANHTSPVSSMASPSFRRLLPPVVHRRTVHDTGVGSERYGFYRECRRVDTDTSFGRKLRFKISANNS
jgi:hypothetical protein